MDGRMECEVGRWVGVKANEYCRWVDSQYKEIGDR